MPASTQAKYGRAARGQSLPYYPQKTIGRGGKKYKHNFKLEPKFIIISYILNNYVFFRRP